MALILQIPNTNLATISKSPNNNLALFYKAQIIIWQLFLQKPKSIFATIPTKAQIYFGKNNYFTLKAQMLFWHIFTKCKYYFDTCFTYTKSHTHGKYIYFYPSRSTSLTRFIKAHEYHPWQNYSLRRDN